MNGWLNVKVTYETVCLTKLLSIDRLIGCLLEVNTRMLGLNGSQAKFDGFIKKVSKHLESSKQYNTSDI